MRKLKVHMIMAARPNFMKVAPLYHVLKDSDWCEPVLVHTGQHYDANMSDAFLKDLQLPTPDIHLGIGSGTHAEHTGQVMIAHEKACFSSKPDWIVVVGDVNSTLACSLVAAKLCIPLAHLEAGLRSGDLTMPEEVNRIVTDRLANVLWTPSVDGNENLHGEGVDPSRISMVGNIMIDAYELLRPKIEQSAAGDAFDLGQGAYAVATLHRPSNVDQEPVLTEIINDLCQIAKDIPIVFPVHPRTRRRLDEFSLWDTLQAESGIVAIDPVGYVAFMSLVTGAKFAITDSGGLQEETTYHNIPCLTLRANTERPITVTQGSNKLVKPADLLKEVGKILGGDWQQSQKPELWDGETAPRIAQDLARRAGRG